MLFSTHVHSSGARLEQVVREMRGLYPPLLRLAFEKCRLALAMFVDDDRKWLTHRQNGNF
jgi:hypothetical protein